MKNYYTLLGLDRNASKHDINVAFKRLSLQFHPDKNGGDSYYLELFKEINEAKQVLLNEEKRAEYDRILLKDFFLKDYLLRKYEGLRRKKQQNFIKKRQLLKKLTQVLKRGSTIVGLAALFLVILIALDTALRFLSKKQAEETITEIRVVKKDPGLTALNVPQKKVKAPAVVIQPQKKIEPAGNAESKISKGSTVSKIPSTKMAQSGKMGTGKLATTKKPSQIKEVSKAPIDKIAAESEDSRKNDNVLNKNKVLLQKQLSDNDLVEVFKDLTSKKLGSNSNTNCVKVVVSANSNVTNAFDITTFLKNKGYIISGRETIKESVEGIKIGTRGGCFVITVGNL